MNKNLFLRFPDIKDKSNYIKYQKEEHNITLDYEKWLTERISFLNQQGIIDGKVPRTILLLTDSNRTIYGQCSVRHSIATPDLSNYIGHVGYEIKREYRSNKLGNLILKLALDYCKSIGLKKVMVSCREDNIPSSKVIENNNGLLEKITFIEKEKTNYKIYWIYL